MQKLKPQWIIFIGLLISYLYIFPRWVDWNQNAHFDLAAAVVERGSLSIDAYVHNTGDYAIFNGRTYVDKAPGLSFLDIPVYALIRPLIDTPLAHSLILMIGHDPIAATTIHRAISQIPETEFVFAANLAMVTLLTVALPSAAFGMLLFHVLGNLGFSVRLRTTVILVYGLFTMTFTYSAALYSHELTAAMLYTIFVWLRSLASRAAAPLELFMLGVLAGYCCITEYPAVPLVMVLALYAIWIIWRFRPIVLIGIGMLIPLISLGLYNNAIFGTPFILAYNYAANPRFHVAFATGILSANFPTLEAIWGLTFSPFRGLFFESPILLTAVPGFALLWQQKNRRAEWLVSLVIPIAMLLLASSSVQWWSGYSAGPRYLIPMLPFLIWPMATTWKWVRQRSLNWRRISQLVIIVLTALSFIVTWSLTVGGQYYAPDDVMNPLIDYSWAHIAAGDVARNVGMLLGLRGGWSLLPLIVFVAITFVTAWRSTKSRAEING